MDLMKEKSRKKYRFPTNSNSSPIQPQILKDVLADLGSQCWRLSHLHMVSPGIARSLNRWVWGTAPSPIGPGPNLPTHLLAHSKSSHLVITPSDLTSSQPILLLPAQSSTTRISLSPFPVCPLQRSTTECAHVKHENRHASSARKGVPLLQEKENGLLFHEQHACVMLTHVSISAVTELVQFAPSVSRQTESPSVNTMRRSKSAAPKCFSRRLSSWRRGFANLKQNSQTPQGVHQPHLQVHLRRLIIPPPMEVGTFVYRN